jgi:hypothetical protein
VAVEPVQESVFLASFPSGMADKAVDDRIRQARDGGLVPQIIGEHMPQRVIRQFRPVTPMLIERPIEPSANVPGKPPPRGLELREHAMKCIHDCQFFPFS